MQEKLLNSIVLAVGGQQAIGLVDLLYNKKNVNEFLIAKKLKLTINQTRNVLYRLADEGLVSFVRKKDSKKGGWYTYYWTLSTGKSLFKLKEKLEKEIEELNGQIARRKSATFYNCPNCEIEFNEENALLHEYTCPECGETLSVKDLTHDIEGFGREIAKKKDILEKINSELTEIEGKEKKVKVRRAKVEEKKKKADREKRKREREREKRKIEKQKEKEKRARKQKKARKKRKKEKKRKKFRKAKKMKKRKKFRKAKKMKKRKKFRKTKKRKKGRKRR